MIEGHRHMRIESLGEEPGVIQCHRSMGIDSLGEKPWGEHYCLFYETKDDLLDCAVPYFKAGLESNEFCVWAIPESLTQQEAYRALSRSVPTFDRHLARQSIEVHRVKDLYFTRGRLDLRRVFCKRTRRLRHAQVNEYSGLRASFDFFWIDTKYWKGVSAHEARLDEIVAGQRMTMLCTCPLAVGRAIDVLDVAQAHHFAMARRRGRWQSFESVGPTTGTRLTRREREVLTWAARGKSAWEIGKILKITKRTADEHALAAVRKLGATNRTEAVALAITGRAIRLGD
jgi:DNA-binding CsgD family transcriptional regulator